MEHKQTVTEVKESRLSVKQKVLFGMGDYLNTITYGMISAFLMAFLTDTLLIPMAAVTAIMSLSKLWDAINDPVIGVIIAVTGALRDKEIFDLAKAKTAVAAQNVSEEEAFFE